MSGQKFFAYQKQEKKAMHSKINLQCLTEINVFIKQIRANIEKNEIK
jgi:hypothetical protein